ncbi:MAG: hypothetical protein B6242_08680, partial [Anaerolineaceae bacterium 4572_78]
PPTVTMNLTYTWQADDHDETFVYTDIDTITHLQAYTWTTDGVKHVMVIVTNDTGFIVSDTHVITLAIPIILTITKAATKTAISNEYITYTLTVLNSGKGIADNVIITDTLPTGTEYVMASDGGMYSDMENTVTWMNQVISDNDSIGLTFTVTVSNKIFTATTSSVITNHDYGVMFNNETVLGTDIVTTTVYSQVHANFFATPTSGKAPLTVVFSNTSIGDYYASTWDFGNGFTSTEISPLHTYAVPGMYTVTLTIKGNGGITSTIYTNYVHVYVPPILTITKIGSPPTLIYEPITYTIFITNHGEVPAYDLVITDVVPTGAYLISPTPNATIATWAFPMLEGSITGTLTSTTVTMVVTATTNITNTTYSVLAEGGYSATGTISVPTVILPYLEVVTTTPQDNGLSILSNELISVTVSNSVFSTSVTADAFRVWGKYTGFYDGDFTVDENTILFDAEPDYKTGEEIIVSLNDDIHDNQQAPLIPYAWQYRTQVTNGTAIFQDKPQTEQSSTKAIATGDLDGDGDIDVFVANEGKNYVLYNNGNGTYELCQPGFQNTSSQEVALGDLDNDEDLDVFVANSIANFSKVLLNNGHCNFSNTSQTFNNANSHDVALGDLDGDGDLDAYLANDEYDQILFNDGNGYFESYAASQDNDNQSVALGDLDNDGDLDALIVDQIKYYVWLNDGHGYFSLHEDNIYTNGRSVSLGDLDNDGDLDAFVAVDDTVEDNIILWNNGDGTYEKGYTTFFTQARYSQDAALADLNGDDYLDIFVSNSNDLNEVWLNNGDKTFTEKIQNFGVQDSYAIALADLDGDNDIDAFEGVHGAVNHVWFNIAWPPEVDFYANENANGVTVAQNMPIEFTYIATPSTIINGQTWNFGDTESDTQTSSWHSYIATGTYTITLTVDGFGGEHAISKTNFITVVDKVSADIEVSPTEGHVPQVVTFTNLSKPFNSIEYNELYFDDGTSFSSTTIFSTIQHTYTKKEVYTARLHVEGLNSFDTDAISITIHNTPPQARNLKIFPDSPNSPTVSDTLVVTYTYFDIDREYNPNTDQEVIESREIRWYRDDAYQPIFYNSTTVSATATYAGEEWCADVRPFDGEDHPPLGSYVKCRLIRMADGTLLNRPPQITSTVLTPSNPRYNDDLIAEVEWYDPDGDDVSLYYYWYVDGHQFLHGSYTNTLAAGETGEGEQWYVRVKPCDDKLCGEYNNSNQVVISSLDNVYPDALDVQITPPNAHASVHDLIGSYVFSDTDVADEEGASMVNWYLNEKRQHAFSGIVPTSIITASQVGTLTISKDNTWTDDDWYMTIIPCDDKNACGIERESNHALVGSQDGNTPPRAKHVSIIPSLPSYTTPLKLFYVYEDVDFDPEDRTIILWYTVDIINQIFVLQPAYTGQTIVPTTTLEIGQIWLAQVIPYDGESYGEPKYSTSVRIRKTLGNHPPEARHWYLTDEEGALLAPGQPGYDTELNLLYHFSDRDGDIEDGTSILWYVNGVVHSDTDLHNRISISADHTSIGEEWYAIVTPRDEFGFGNSITSNQVTIGENFIPTKPEAHNLTILPTMAIPNNRLRVEYNYFSPDAVDECLTRITWEKNGIRQFDLQNQSNIIGSLTRGGDTWQAEVCPYDCVSYGECQKSRLVQINTPPTATIWIENATISGTVPHGDLELGYNYFDADDDEENTNKRQITWHLRKAGENDFIHQAQFDNQTIITESNIIVGDSWKVELQVHDGFQFGVITYTIVTIVPTDVDPDSTLPTATLWIIGANENNVVPYDIDVNLGYTYHGTENHDEIENLRQVQWSWRQPYSSEFELLPEFNDEMSVSAAETKAGEIWKIELRVHDGRLGLTNSITVAIGSKSNTPPTATIHILGADANGNIPLIDLEMEYNYFDADGHSEDESKREIRWSWRDSNSHLFIHQEDFDDKFVVPVSRFSTGDSWLLELRVHDHYTFSNVITKVITIVRDDTNTPPTATLWIKGADENGNIGLTDLRIGYEYYDEDGDPEDESKRRIRWSLRDIGQVDFILQERFNDKMMIPESEVKIGQSWLIKLRVHDGITFSPIVTTVVTIIDIPIPQRPKFYLPIILKDGDPYPYFFIDKTGTSEVESGGTIFYTIDIINSGNADAINVIIHDELPKDTAYIDGGDKLDDSIISWEIGFLAVGYENKETVTFTVKAPHVTATQIVTNDTYYVTCNGGIRADGKNTVTTIVKPLPQPILTIDKTGTSEVESGGTIFYTITVKNIGDANATGLIVRDTLPVSTTYITGGNFSNGVVTWTKDSLAINDSTEFMFTVETPHVNDETSVINHTYDVTSTEGVSAIGDTQVEALVKPLPCNPNNNLYEPNNSSDESCEIKLGQPINSYPDDEFDWYYYAYYPNDEHNAEDVLEVTLTNYLPAGQLKFKRKNKATGDWDFSEYVYSIPGETTIIATNEEIDGTKIGDYYIGVTTVRGKEKPNDLYELIIEIK